MNHLTTEEISAFKQKLEEEKERLETDLKEIGHKNPGVPGDWEAVATDLDSSINADKNEVADKIGTYEGNAALVKQFETELLLVKDSLAKIESGTYGTCAVCEKGIEKERLEANPSATTCMEHLNTKV